VLGDMFSQTIALRDHTLFRIEVWCHRSNVRLVKVAHTATPLFKFKAPQYLLAKTHLQQPHGTTFSSASPPSQ